ncbi:hypothetical protein HYT25_02410 [Candidatus Pacearchaeota archaeon]|nr:hypothetical protein [Candidatus Pacearchaeota archaeon]
MEQEIKANVKEIMTKLTRLQSDVDYIKERLSLEEEMIELEQASIEDSADFFEKNNL